MRIEDGSTPITIDTLRARRMVQPFYTAHGTWFRVIGADVLLVETASSLFPPAPCLPLTPPTRPSTSHAVQSMSSLFF